MQLINRPEYIDFLVRSKDKQIIKVVSGIRRCGKSTLFDIYRSWLIGQGVAKEQIIDINFEEIDNQHLTTYHDLYEYLKQHLLPDKMNYIFLDEIQHVAQFEKVVDSLFIKNNVDLYITGSNAYFMSGDMATLLTGRYIELKMLPLSFAEYCEGLSLYQPELSLSKMEKYAMYISTSSFPYTLQIYDQQREMRSYLSGLYSSIFLSDIVARLKISDVMLLESVTRYVFNNIGNLLSTTKIANTLTSSGRKINYKTVEKYVQGLIDSLVIYQARRYNIRGKQLLATLEKYYVSDIGLRRHLIGSGANDQGSILENIIYLELLRRGTEVYVGKLDNGEIDFITRDGTGITYYQVAASVLDSTTLRRELMPLDNLKDHYPKNLLTLDEVGSGSNYNGIRQINALDWLLAKPNV